MKNKMEHYLPVKGISINECFQGRRFKTKKYNAFIEEMLYTMPKQKMIKGMVRIGIAFSLKSILRSDLDNLLKPVIDCVVKKGWIEDDRFIQSIEAHKILGDKEEIRIKIESLK